ncbi:MAG: sugar ABC transporter permease [Candidatus Promineifilaceae bacterium]|nr:sugar ABC transporter permease [Candidatus Promineifilaceae bacterium]
MSTEVNAPGGAAVRGPKPERVRRRMSDRAIRHTFIWPALILLILINVFPLFYSLYLSFTDYSAIANQAPNWIAFENFGRIFSDEQMWEIFGTTGQYVLFSVGLQIIFGFALALLVRDKFRGSGLITTLILVPMMLSPVVVGLFWKLMYNPTFGYFNYLIGFDNPAMAPDWLASRFAGEPVPGLALWAVILVDVWMWTPFVMLLVLSGLKAIPEYLYEAAAIDRASSWFQFWRITLPQVAPLLLIAVLFRTIEAINKSFDLVMGMTGGGPGIQTEVVAVNLYRQAFLGQWRTGRASALAYVILIIVIAVSNIYIRYLNKMRGEE